MSHQSLHFQLHSLYQPAGDQPKAIQKLVEGIEQGKNRQVLLGVTGSGKTFTMAGVIAKIQKPTLVIAHNKTLAAQLYQEFRDFFPNNAVSYFVSYYDYYQPEAYIPSSDTYIEKEATINDEIDRLRLATTTNLLTRPDAIVVASVSCIYNLGSPVEYGRYLLRIAKGEIIQLKTLLLQLENLQYDRSNTDLRRGTYRLRGESLQVWPAYEEKALRIDLFANTIEQILWIDPISANPLAIPLLNTNANKEFIIYPAKHYVIDPVSQEEAIEKIKTDLKKRLDELNQQKKIVEAYRLKQKIEYDLEMIRQFGFVNGIENYSRYFDGRKPGDPPFTLLDYLAENGKRFGDGSFLTLIDESHMTIPQIHGMHRGDESRKQTLINYGFRLPSAQDNRPLRYDEFNGKTPYVIAVSATPAAFEIKQASGEVVEQVVRPTGLLDPLIELRPIQSQIDNLILEIILRKINGQRTLVTTLTKKMSEDLTDYLNNESKVRALYQRALEERKKFNNSREKGLLSESTIWQLETLPIDSMDVGPIEHKYYNHLANSPTQTSLYQILPKEIKEFPKVAYLHSDIETLDRSEILKDLRFGKYDVLVGINLLREGLDLPEVSLVAILDADKEGFLRSETSLVQTMGRAARHLEGLVILYADRLTGSMRRAISETQRRRHIQQEFNSQHHITPKSISKPIRPDMIVNRDKKEQQPTSIRTTIKLDNHEQILLSDIHPEDYTPAERKQLVKQLKKQMNLAAKDLDFELATIFRDAIAVLLKS